MEFCPKCGSIIVIKDEKASCANCSYKLHKTPKIKSFEKIEKKEEVAIVKEGQEDVYPIVDMKCPKCKHPKCYFWTLQTRAGDESETKFFKCLGCKHIWRVYR